MILRIKGFFTKFLVRGLAFGDDFSVPVGDRDRWGGEARVGDGVR